MDSQDSSHEPGTSDVPETSSVATSGDPNADNNAPPPRLPPIYPNLPGRHNPSFSALPGLAGLMDPSQAFQASDPLDPGLRRLLLLQTLAAQQQQILQALGNHPGGLPAHLAALAPTPPGTPQIPSPNSSSSQYPQAATPEAYHHPHHQEAQWSSVIEGLNIVPVQPSSPFDAGVMGRRSSVASASSSTSTAVSTAQELEQAQAQLDAWSQIVFTSGAPSALPAGLTSPASSSTSFMPPAFDWASALYPQQFVVSPASTSMSAENSASPPSRTRAMSVSRKTKPKVEQEDREEYEEEEVEEDKRKRNTAASARFRAKKKQRDAELQQTSAQLRERLADLEKQANSLKAENQWLRDLISEKTEPRLQNSK